MTVRTIASMLVLWIAMLGCQASEDSGERPVVTEISQETLLGGPPEGALILDVRTPGEYASGHVPDARNIPHDQLASRLAELEGDTDRPVVVYCKSGRRAAMASSTLIDAGYTNVLHLAGDMDGWKQKGLPVETAEESLQ